MLGRRTFLITASTAAIASTLKVRPASAAIPSMKDGDGYDALCMYLYQLLPHEQPGPNGEAGANRTAYRYIEEQAQGAAWIRNGLVQNRANMVATGWKELDYGLNRQLADGSFGSQFAFHSTSFFIEGLARACLMQPSAATAARLNGLRRAVNWFVTPSNWNPGISGNQQYTHRRYLVAAALYQASRVLGDTSFLNLALSQINDGLGLQRSDGVNPERGGPDVGYHMLGVLMAYRCLPSLSGTTLSAVKTMLTKALNWELTKIDDEGVVDSTGSTRTGVETDYQGRIKSVPYTTICEAFYLCADVFNGNLDYLNAGDSTSYQV